MSEALRPVVDEAVLALAPLMEAVRAPEKMLWLLSELGWTPGSVPQPLADLATAGSDLLGLVGADPDATSTPEVFGAVGKLVAAIDEIRTMPDSAFPSGLDVISFKATIGTDLLDYLLVEHLLSYHYSIAGPLLLAGFIRLAPQPASGLRQPYLRRQVMWSAAGETFEDPVRGFREAFDWNSSAPRLTAALGALGSLLEQAGLRFSYIRPADGLLAFVTAGATDPAYDYLGIDVVFDTQTLDTTGFAAGLRLLVLSATASRGPAMGLLPYATLTEAVGVEVADNLTLSVQGDADFTKGIALVLAPGQPVGLETGFLGGQATSPAAVNVKLTYTPPPGEPERVLVGTADGSRLSIQGLTLAAGATLISPGRIDAFVQLDLRNALVAIKPAPGEANSFIGSLLGDQGISAQLSFGLRLSSLTGFHLTGSDGLRANLPADVHLGPVDIQAIELGLDTSGGDVSLEVGAAVAGTIGPLSILADGLGFTVTARFPSPPTGNLGPVDLSLGFKPPDGVGLVVDAAGVTGGGFLRHDPAKHEYSGVLQLQFIDLALQAFGLITTQVAGGEGYSLLALVDAEFPPVQLGWGFTLNGVGGLLAIHRTASTDALHAALKAGQLSTILFPKNAITNAPAILSQLDALFPTAPGRFLFGPMALIGWGTPTMLTASIAVVVELPEPVRVILLARIEARMPDPLVPLVRINMDALGILDLGKGELSFDAVLFDSRLVIYTMSGAMALRATWAAQREFVLAIGGFHPRFTPPAGFPMLQRMTIDMPSGIVTKLRLSAYLALTSNSIQIGANLDALIGVSGFGLSGHLGFDALLLRHPFHFEADISGSVALTAGGDDLASVSLDATLTGPAPYNIAGKFKVHVVFFDVHVSFNHSWGEDAPSLPVPSVDVGALLGAGLTELDSWDALLPVGLSPLVSVRRIEDASRVLAHPLARPQVHERIVPLGLAITRYGEAAPTGATQFAITDLHVGTDPHVGSTAIPHEAIQDDFAPAQFFELTDEEKLARPSFERHDAGVRVAGGLVASGAPTSKTTAYETFYVDEPGGVPRADPGVVVTPPGLGDLRVALRFGSAGRAAIKSSGRRYQTAGTPLRVAEPAFVVADTSTMALSGVGPAAGATFSDLHALLGSRRGLQIVATHELAA